ncbi:MAG: hypothetical protein A3A86_05330 [Elusimicrobia bacterium RIFCSPLOWO2_01_FULL_60_11]|nr:MAG: hypothetical protein A3A86_05330 [Elusimicrobia bacterium RIFCSPLOWO2_01_FULL_60_11]
MGKYWAAFSLSIQQELYYRASFLMERARSITVIIAFYAFWSAVFQGRDTLLGYTRSQMFTYILGMNVLRALVFSDKTWELMHEINTGKISSYLMRPISYVGFCLSRDAADKATQLVSSILEVALAAWLLKIPLYWPAHPATFAVFGLTLALAIVLYFLMSYIVATFAFWTSESAGPRFCFELFLEFSSGAFFPLDVLPRIFQSVFSFLPFASLLYFPLNVFLERITGPLLARGLGVQVFWAVLFVWAARRLWERGLKAYSADGG